MAPEFVDKKMILLSKRLWALFAIALFVWSCSNSSAPKKDDSWTANITLPEDMILVSGKKELFLGTDDTTALKKEQPRMGVRLTYDYFMGKHEVTCSEYYKLMKNQDADTASCHGEPITGISYYDAVLYANERSKAENFDTIYVYSDKMLDNKGRCVKLVGLYYKALGLGYRLPTEAEWVYVAGRHWNLDLSWTGRNAKGEKHEVCSLKADSDGFCDMTGNVMEWTNDWLAVLNDTTVENFGGAADGGSLDERVVKGGSYHHDNDAIRLYSRGDTYTVSSNTRLDYLGFRLAFGPIPMLYCTGSDGSVNDSKVNSLEDITKLEKIMGGFQAKIAFRNDVTGNLIVNDYSESEYAMMEYKDSMEVYHPEISPNGSKVAFCTKPEGVPGKSEIYVRNITHSGDELVKLEFENAAIPRWRVRAPGDTVIVFVTDAEENTDTASWKKKATWQVSFSYDEFGEPEKLFDGTFNGGVSSDNSLAVSGARLLRANVHGKDTVWFNGEQACNASLSKDGSNRTLFLDFASSTGRNFANRKYGVHQQLLVVDSLGRLVHSVPAPKNYAFDHTEWVVGAENYKGKNTGFVVATLTNSNGAHEKISLVDLSDSSIVDLFDGDELWHPNLWIKALPASFVDSLKELDLDSAARYYIDATSQGYSAKMNDFWAMSDSLEIVGIGSSRMVGGFWPIHVSAGKAYNMGVSRIDMDAIDFVADKYILPHCKKLKYLIVAIDLDLWDSEHGVQVEQAIEPSKAFIYDENHDYWKDGAPSEFILLNRYYANQIQSLASRHRNLGWNRYEIGSWTDTGFNSNAIVEDSTWSDHNGAFKEDMKVFEKLIEKAQEKDVRIIGLVFPQSPYYKKTGAFGRHGMRRSTADSLLKVIVKWPETHSNFKYIDENKMGDHDYTDRMAFDYDHLSFVGAKRLTAKLDSIIKAWNSGI